MSNIFKKILVTSIGIIVSVCCITSYAGSSYTLHIANGVLGKFEADGFSRDVLVKAWGSGNYTPAAVKDGDGVRLSPEKPLLDVIARDIATTGTTTIVVDLHQIIRDKDGKKTADMPFLTHACIVKILNPPSSNPTAEVTKKGLLVCELNDHGDGGGDLAINMTAPGAAKP